MHFLALTDGKTPAAVQAAVSHGDAELTGESIAYHRKRLGLSQAELDELIGRSDSCVSQVERGVRAIDRLSVLQKVADVLSVPVAELRGSGQAETGAATERPALRITTTARTARTRRTPWRAPVKR